MKIIILLFTLLTFTVRAEIFFDLSSPRNSFKTFLKHMVAVKNHENKKTIYNKLEAILEKNEIPLNVEDISTKLVNALDRIEKVNYENIPAKTNETKWTYLKRKVKINSEVYHTEISFVKVEENWLISKETSNSITYLSEYLKDQDTVEDVKELITWKTKIKKKFPAWTGKRRFLLLNGQWLGILLIIIIGFIGEMIGRILIGSFIVKKLAKRKMTLDAKIENKFMKPFGVMAFSIIWYFLIQVIELEPSILNILLRLAHITFAISITRATHHAINIIAIFFQNKADKTVDKFDDILIPLLRKSAVILTYTIGFVVIAQSLTFDITNIVAGLGIGGLAFALAAKDTLANVFGSLTVLLDRPFEIGDGITINNNVTGTIEEVGFRSTKIRTFYDSIITIPNSQLTNVHIDNLGKRVRRRFNTSVAIQYDTPPDKIEAFCEGIRNLILNQELADNPSFHVYLHEMSASSLDIYLYVFFNTTDRAVELAERHKLIMNIIKLAESMGVEFAFPTQTLHLFNESQKELIQNKV